MTPDVAHLHHVADRHAVVDEGEAAVAGARIVVARLVVVVRQLDERHVLAHRHRVGRRGHAGDRAGEQPAAASAATAAGAAAAVFRNRSGALLRSGRVAAAASAAGVVGEGQRHFDLAVLRKGFRARQVERAPRAIEAVGARPQRVAGAGDVAQQEVGGVDEHAAVALTGDGEAPDHRLGERVFDRLALERVRAAGAERHVRLHHQHARADALERDDARAAAAAAIQADVVRAEAGGQAGVHQDVGIELRDLDEQRSGALVPVEREEAVDLLHARGARVDRLDRPAPACPPPRRRRVRRRRPAAAALGAAAIHEREASGS